MLLCCFSIHLQGLAGTANGSIWYINWIDTDEMESLRIVAGHKTRVNFDFSIVTSWLDVTLVNDIITH